METLNLSLRLSPAPLPNQVQAEAIRPSTTERSNNEAVQTNQRRPNNEAEQSNKKRRRTKADNSPIEPPYPWSTRRRAVVHELEYLRSKEIVTITGQVKCRRCERRYEMEYDLAEKFEEVRRFIEMNKSRMHDRAPNCWVNPVLPDCMICMQEKCVEPVIPQDEKDDSFSRINWLFLLLGQILGRLKLKQLKYFCNHTSIHRTGAKNRLLYLTYLALCRQLEPSNRLFSCR